MTVVHGAQIVVAEAAASIGRQRLAVATDQVIADAGNLVGVAISKRAVHVCRGKGHAAEGLLVLTFNRDAARNGASMRAEWAHLTDCHAAADIRVVDGSRLLAEGQVKTDQDPYRLVRTLRRTKYEGMQRIVTEEQVDDVRAVAERQLDRAAHQDLLDNLAGELAHESVSSSSVSRADAQRAAMRPRTTAAKLAATECAREIGGAAGKGAIAGSALAVVTSGMHNVRSVRHGEKESIEALLDVVKDAGRSGAVTGGTAGLGAVVGVAARRAGAPRFAASGGPIAVAGVCVEAGAIVRRHLSGEIDHLAMREEIAAAAARGGAAYYGGLVGQALIPVPVVGALIGSFVACAAGEAILATIAMQRTELAHLRLERQALDKLASHARDVQARQRADLDQLAAAHASELRWLTSCADHLLLAVNADDNEAALAAMTELRLSFGVPKVLPFDTFSSAMDQGGARLTL